MQAVNQRILCYFPEGYPAEHQKALGDLARRAKLRLTEIPPEFLSQAVGRLAGYADSGQPPGSREDVLPTEPILILCGLTAAKRDEWLDRLRQSSIPPISCKAVLTDTNRRWSVYALYRELCSERGRLAGPCDV